MNCKMFRGGASLDDCVVCEDMICCCVVKMVKLGGVVDGWMFIIVCMGEL